MWIKKFKNFKISSIVFLILWVIYISIRFLAKSIISVDRVCHENQCFIVEVARTDQEMQKWLMYREKLWRNKWMIFVFKEEKKHSFWMKNTLIPLDIIRIDSDWKIVDIQTATQCKTSICPKYNPKSIAKYVLEINAWISQQKDIKIWDNLKLKLK